MIYLNQMGRIRANHQNLILDLDVFLEKMVAKDQMVADAQRITDRLENQGKLTLKNMVSELMKKRSQR